MDCWGQCPASWSCPASDYNTPSWTLNNHPEQSHHQYHHHVDHVHHHTWDQTSEAMEMSMVTWHTGASIITALDPVTVTMILITAPVSLTPPLHLTSTLDTHLCVNEQSTPGMRYNMIQSFQWLGRLYQMYYTTRSVCFQHFRIQDLLCVALVLLVVLSQIYDDYSCHTTPKNEIL